MWNHCLSISSSSKRALAHTDCQSVKGVRSCNAWLHRILVQDCYYYKQNIFSKPKLVEMWLHCTSHPAYFTIPSSSWDKLASSASTYLHHSCLFTFAV